VCYGCKHCALKFNICLTDKDLGLARANIWNAGAAAWEATESLARPSGKRGHCLFWVANTVGLIPDSNLREKNVKYFPLSKSILLLQSVEEGDHSTGSREPNYNASKRKQS